MHVAEKHITPLQKRSVGRAEDVIPIQYTVFCIGAGIPAAQHIYISAEIRLHSGKRRYRPLKRRAAVGIHQVKILLSLSKIAVDPHSAAVEISRIVPSMWENSDRIQNTNAKEEDHADDRTQTSLPPSHRAEQSRNEYNALASEIVRRTKTLLQ